MNSTATATRTGRRFEVVGTTDEHDGCDCCGRMNLKRYVVLKVVDCNAEDSGDFLYYGTGCAATAEGIPAKVIKAEADRADRAARAAAEAIRQAKADAEHAAFTAWKIERTGTADQWEAAKVLGLDGAFAVYKMWKAER